MREAFETLISTLKDLKKEGTRSVWVAPGTLAALSESVQKQLASVPMARSSNSSPESGNEASAKPGPDDSKAFAKNATPTQTTPSIKPARQDATPAARSIAETPATTAPKLPNPPILEIPEGAREQRLAWLQNRVLNCEVCLGHVRPGKKVVFGVGSPQADIFFCGEAPGAEEETQGEPFVGPAGELLTRIIKAMGLARTDVYIGNIMNWRPETTSEVGNRPPTPEEMAFCLPYLKAQVAIVQPKVIVALGATAVHGLLGYDPKRSITKSRGSWHEFEGIPTMITLHPSYVLRNGSNTVKRQIWEDMLATMERIGLPISQRQRDFFR